MSDTAIVKTAGPHIAILDGVRGMSILLVLAGHLLPLGPKAWQLNGAAASMGMSLFFILSGFLITRALMAQNALVPFLVQRLARIAPLAYLFMAVVFVAFDHDPRVLMRELTFTLNYDKGAMGAFNPHLWSLCVEVQFYILMGLLFRLLRAPAPLIVVGLCLAATVLKIIAHDPFSVETQVRGDELLAGSVLFLSLNGTFGDHRRFWRRVERFTPALLGLLVLACRPGDGPLDYVRAYAAALLVGSVVVTRRVWLARALSSRPMGYLAKVSYALYVIHIGAAAGIAAVMGTGSKLALYLVQRPLTFVVTFGLAHLSTFRYEARFIAWGRTFVAAWRRGRAGSAPALPSGKAPALPSRTAPALQSAKA